MFKFKKIIFILLVLFFTINPNVYAKFVYLEECEYSFSINDDDKFDKIVLSAPEVTDEGTTFTIEAQDKKSGINKIDFFINGELYQEFEYDNVNLNETQEIFEVEIEYIPFYEECYALGVDTNGNSLKSNSIIPNHSRINDLKDLLKFKELQNNQVVNFKDNDIYLLNDINLLNYYTKENCSWIPISSKEVPFEGNFYGNSHIISNLKIETTSNYQGLFGRNDGIIKDLKIVGNIVANDCRNIGGIAGRNYGIIENCKSDVQISGTAKQIGGIVGLTTNGIVRNCINYNSIYGLSYIGGICGYCQDALIECCGNRENAQIGCIEECGGGITRLY